MATENGHTDVVGALLKAGAKFSETHIENGRPLRIAREKGYLGVVRLLEGKREKDAENNRPDATSEACYFCAKNRATKEAAVRITLNQILAPNYPADLLRLRVRYGLEPVKWKNATIGVPRCSNCLAIHERPDRASRALKAKTGNVDFAFLCAIPFFFVSMGLWVPHPKYSPMLSGYIPSKWIMILGCFIIFSLIYLLLIWRSSVVKEKLLFASIPGTTQGIEMVLCAPQVLAVEKLGWGLGEKPTLRDRTIREVLEEISEINRRRP